MKLSSYHSTMQKEMFRVDNRPTLSYNIHFNYHLKKDTIGLTFWKTGPSHLQYFLMWWMEVDCWTTGSPSSLQECGCDSCLRAVLCYKPLFTKACMECKRFFLKERKNVMFLNKINLPYCPRLRPFWSVFGELALFWCSTAKRKTRQNSDFLK